MAEEQTSPERKQRPMIARADTKNKVLSIEDGDFTTLDGTLVQKVVWNHTDYGADPSQNFQHSMDLDDFRIVANDLTAGRTIKGLDGKEYVEYKGNPRKEPITSKVLRISVDKTPGKEGYWVNFAQGPGKVTGTGMVQPAYEGGKPEREGSFKLALYEARRVGYQALEYLSAKAVAKMLSATKERRE